MGCPHSSDRLLTDPTSFDPLDPTANKSIVFATRGGIIALGYSGLAVVGYRGTNERTTDHWLAERLTGGAPGMAVTLGTPEYRHDVGLAIRNLKMDLESDRRFAAADTQVTFCGVQWQRGRPERGVFSAYGSLTRAKGGGYELKHFRFRAGRDEPHALIATPDGVGLDLDELLAQLAASSSPEAAEDLMIGAIQEAAGKSPAIGPDCLVVRIANAPVRIRYEGRRPVIGPERMPATPIPWIVTPGAAAAPMVVATPKLTVGGVAVEVEVPAFVPQGEVIGPGKTPGRLIKRVILPGFTTHSPRYGMKPPDIPPPPAE